MTAPEVVVTGMGVVAEGAADLDAVWSALVAGGPTRGTLTTFDPLAELTSKVIDRTARFTQYALVAAQRALVDAGSPRPEATRAGVVFGNVYGALDTVLYQSTRFFERGPRSVHPFYGGMIMENAPASHVALAQGWRGPTKVVVGACATGAHAIEDAAALIRSGRCDLVVTGATQGPPTEPVQAAYRNMRVLSRSGHLRPFDHRRDGFVLADGAAVLVLEAGHHAAARGAPVWGRVLGAGNTNDAHSMSMPSQLGGVECMRAALADAGLGPSDIVHVNAHGTGTVVNDEVEAAGLAEVFGRPGPPVTSTKGVFGHAFAAAGAMEAVGVFLAMRNGLIPAVGADGEPDPALGLDVVHGGARPWTPGPVLSNSFGLGGTNGCLVLAP